MKIFLPVVFALSTITTFTTSTTLTTITASAQPAFSNALDTLFSAIKSGQIPDRLLTGKDTSLTRSILLDYGPIAAMHHEIINQYPVEKDLYRLLIACDTLHDLLTVDARLDHDQIRFTLPLWHDTRYWREARIGTIHYYYDHDFDPKAGAAFDAFNRELARKLGLKPQHLDFYLTDNYQQIRQLLGHTYDRSAAGKYRDGSYADERTMFAIMHNEDFSHDLVHFYISKVRTNPRNAYAEEGLAYYWGNAYYTDSAGQMITYPRIRADLRAYFLDHPQADPVSLFRQNMRGLFKAAPEISIRAAMAAVLMEAIEKEHGLPGILQLMNCGPGEQNYFSALDKLTGVNAANFNERLRYCLRPDNPHPALPATVKTPKISDASFAPAPPQTSQAPSQTLQ